MNTESINTFKTFKCINCVAQFKGSVNVELAQNSADSYPILVHFLTQQRLESKNLHVLEYLSSNILGMN